MALLEDIVIAQGLVSVLKANASCSQSSRKSLRDTLNGTSLNWKRFLFFSFWKPQLVWIGVQKTNSSRKQNTAFLSYINVWLRKVKSTDLFCLKF